MMINSVSSACTVNALRIASSRFLFFNKKKSGTNGKQVVAADVPIDDGYVWDLGLRSIGATNSKIRASQAPVRQPLAMVSAEEECHKIKNSEEKMVWEIPTVKLKSMLPRRKDKAVLVLAGSLNPPTIFHLRMFELAKDELMSRGYDVLGGYMSPVNDKYAKPDLASAKHRVEMCELATKDSSLIMVDKWESQQSEYVRSIRLLERYALELNKFPEADPVQIFFLCGSDLIESMFQSKAWNPEHIEAILNRSEAELKVKKKDDSLLTKAYIKESLARSAIEFDSYRIIATARFGHSLPEEASHPNIMLIHDPSCPDGSQISSTTVRRLLRDGESARHLIPEAVQEYINCYKVYAPP